MHGIKKLPFAITRLPAKLNRARTKPVLESHLFPGRSIQSVPKKTLLGTELKPRE